MQSKTKRIVLYAFTLAEVLITLGIIGIIAAITIPTLLQSTNDIELKSAWKKTYSAIAQASISVKNDNGGTFSNISCSATYVSDCLRDAYSNYLKYVTTCDAYSINYYGNCFHPATGLNLDTIKLLNGTSSLQINSYSPYFGEGASGVILSSGELVLFKYRVPACNDPAHVEGFSTGCGWITVDVNGFKGPNTVGRDIFSIDLLEDRVVPTGMGNLSNTCNSSSSGQGCAAQYLYN